MEVFPQEFLVFFVLIGAFTGVLTWVFGKLFFGRSLKARLTNLGVSFAVSLFFGMSVSIATGTTWADLFTTEPFVKVFIGAFYFLVMLAGMAAEYMFGLRKFKHFEISEFVRPFWVAILVFAIPWAVVEKSVITYASVLACYQNGFFWKKILEQFGPSTRR